MPGLNLQINGTLEKFEIFRQFGSKDDSTYFVVWPARDPLSNLMLTLLRYMGEDPGKKEL